LIFKSTHLKRLSLENLVKLTIYSSIVEFAVRDDMEYALKKLNDRELNGQRVTLREVYI
jgi:hypothetical protein